MPEILFVDDDIEFEVPYYINALKRRGFNVTHFAEVPEALAYIRSDNISIDIAVIDLIMPKPVDNILYPIPSHMYSGEYIYQELRKLYQNTWVILFSAIADYSIPSVTDSKDDYMYLLLKTRHPPRSLATHLYKLHFSNI